MKKKFLKIFKSISFTNFFFFVLSLVSTTFAWFAFSNIVNSDLSVNVKAWNVSITDGENQVTNQINVDVDDIYPGTNTTSGDAMVTNNGDLSAKVFYRIKSLRLFDTTVDVTNESVIDNLALNYPFTFNFSLDSDVIEPGESVIFKYSIDWPTDSGNNAVDAQWGSTAASFIANEQSHHNSDPTYVIRSGISLVVELVVEQNIDESENSINFGDSKYLNSITHNECTSGSANCVEYLKMASDSSGVYYMGKISDDYEATTASGLSSLSNIITLNDMLSVIKNDIYDSRFVINNYSDRLIGNVSDVSLLNSKINIMQTNNGYIKFSKNQFYYLQSSTCYWLNTTYDSTHTYAVKNIDNDYIKIYPEQNTNSCKAIPIIYVENQE